jgi:hypothetical protein
MYKQGMNIAANAYVMWHLPGTGFELFKAKAAITNAPLQLDPIQFEKYELGEIVDRRFLQDWLDDDFEIGHVIEDGDYEGMIVSEVIALGGTFPSWEGGNRGTFNSGVAGDTMRNSSESLGDFIVSGMGILKGLIRNPSYAAGGMANTLTGASVHLDYDFSYVFPTYYEFSTRTESWRKWRRVA